MTASSSERVHVHGREPLRLRMSERTGHDRLDGGWWPQSRDLAVELQDLVANFPPELGRIMRAVYSPPDWDSHERRVTLSRGYLKVGSFPHDDTHLIDVQLRNRDRLRLLVIPSAMTEVQGTEALLAAATVGNSHSAAELLSTVADQPAVDPDGHWHDQGGSYWEEGTGPPSHRPGS
jgi:Family of unknown function (DUF5994)